MDRHAENAPHLAKSLEAHPAVEKVNYPGFSGHPQHALAGRQMSGWGGMLSFVVRGGVEAGRILMNNPASLTHAVMPKEMRERMGISDGLVRVSVGIEDKEDILADFAQGLAKI